MLIDLVEIAPRALEDLRERRPVIGRRAPVDLATFVPAISGSEAPQPSGARQVRFKGGWSNTRLFDRASIGRGARLAGPAITAKARQELRRDFERLKTILEE